MGTMTPVVTNVPTPTAAPVFIPAFDENVYLINPFSSMFGMQHINADMCATTPCAIQLAALLKDLNPTMVLGPVFGLAAGQPFGVPIVPWLQFPSKMAILAGTLAMWWKREPDPQTAMTNCRIEIAANEAYWQLILQGQNP